VVDQYGNPVSGAMVHFVAISGHLAQGSGHQKVTTDNKGVFEIDDVVGTGLSVDKIIKEGYEVSVQQRNFDNFLRFEDSVLWSDYTKDNPFVFKAWKVATSGYPKTSQSDGVYTFESGKVYSLDLTNSNKRKVVKKGSFDLDLQVQFNRNDSNWDLKLSVPDGGLLESDEPYM
ncbi:MAG: hypothetical protein GY701_35180, partial [Sulfitobacter sp.]|nr:hypothetical protein [Sulfitobacter sp.]